MNHIQALVDGMSQKFQKDRAASQMTLGEMIEILEQMPSETKVCNLNSAHSYRGYYCDLAFEPGDGTRPAAELLAECRSAMGNVFEGYKGGDFVMGKLTPVWVAHYGDCGEKLLTIATDGTITTGHDD